MVPTTSGSSPVASEFARWLVEQVGNPLLQWGTGVILSAPHLHPKHLIAVAALGIVAGQHMQKRGWFSGWLGKGTEDAIKFEETHMVVRTKHFKAESHTRSVTVPIQQRAGSRRRSRQRA